MFKGTHNCLHVLLVIVLLSPMRSGDAGAAEAGSRQDAKSDVAVITSKDITIGDDKHKRYFLIGPKTDAKQPEAGYHLLVVLPGGDGGDGFHSFVTRIFKHALPDHYLVAQAVAPQWRDDENRIVWPTKKLGDAKMKFSTEEFVAEIIKDVRDRLSIDTEHIYLLGWSSGGPACYAASLQRKSPVKGAFVAMSVFKPKTLPPLKRAKGKAYYLLHSPDDFIAMRFPEAARDKLTKAGAKVHLETYEGGHGWRGDMYGRIREGIVWLEAQ